MSSSTNVAKQPCRFFVQNKCNRGRNCRYSHDVTHLPGPGNPNQAPSNPSTPRRGTHDRGRAARERRVRELIAENLPASYRPVEVPDSLGEPEWEVHPSFVEAAWEAGDDWAHPQPEIPVRGSHGIAINRFLLEDQLEDWPWDSPAGENNSQTAASSTARGRGANQRGIGRGPRGTGRGRGAPSSSEGRPTRGRGDYRGISDSNRTSRLQDTTNAAAGPRAPRNRFPDDLSEPQDSPVEEYYNVQRAAGSTSRGNPSALRGAGRGRGAASSSEGRPRGRGDYRGVSDSNNRSPRFQNTNAAAQVRNFADQGTSRRNTVNYIPPPPPPEPAPKKPEAPAFLDKVLGGSMAVRMGPGLSIMSISPITVSSESSSIMFENIPLGTPLDAIQTLVQPFKPTISPHAIKMNSRDGTLSVTVHFDETVAANDALQVLNGAFCFGVELAVKALKPTAASEDVTKIECSWFPASATAVVRFASSEQAAELVDYCTRSEVMILGRRVKALAQKAGGLTSSSRLTVLLVNLAAHTTEDHIRTQLTNMLLFTSMTLREPKYQLSDEETLRYIRQKFEIGREDNLLVTSREYETRSRAMITYTSASNAIAVFGKVKAENDETLRTMNFTSNLTYSVSFKIPGEIWKVIKDEVSRLEREERARENERKISVGGGSIMKSEETEDNAPARMRIFERGGRHAPTMVHVNSNGRVAVAKVKGAIQKLLRGKLICDDDGNPLWDNALRGPSGRQLVQVVMESGVHVYVDYRNRTVTMYGSTTRIAPAELLMKEQYALLMTMQHELSLHGNQGRFAFGGGIAAVQELLGEDMVVVDHANHKLVVRCSPAEISNIRTLLYKPHFRKNAGQGQAASASTENAEDPCPVCMEPAEAPVVKTTCGHTYCKSCIASFIKATIDGRRFPINCFHSSDDGVACAAPLSISIIESVLSKADSDNLLDIAFSTHIQARPNQYSYCPTPDCPTVYLITDTESFFTCNQCLGSVCTACKVAAHHGQTCEEYKAAISGDKEFQDWKKRAGVKTCPKCSADIEKNQGCNHMSCKCGAHLCWHCMKSFTIAATVYEHMRTECRGIYDDDEPAAVANPPPAPPRAAAAFLAPPINYPPQRAFLPVPNAAMPPRPPVGEPFYLDQMLDAAAIERRRLRRVEDAADVPTRQAANELLRRQRLVQERAAERERAVERLRAAERVAERERLAERQRVAERARAETFGERLRVHAIQQHRREQEEAAAKKESSGGFCVMM